MARNLHEHAFENCFGTPSCPVCGAYQSSVEIDLNVLNFERFRWGGIRHDQPAYIWLDLSQLRKSGAVEPTSVDHLMLSQIIATARMVPASGRLKDLSKALAKVLPSNEFERRTLISILRFCGILVDLARPDFRTAFPNCEQREYTSYSKDDWPYPVRWWTGRFGVNEQAVTD